MLIRVEKLANRLTQGKVTRGSYVLLYFGGHLGRHQVGVTFSGFAAEGERGMADGQEPEDGGHHDADNGNEAKQRNSIQDGVQAKPAPLFAGQEIYGWNE